MTSRLDEIKNAIIAVIESEYRFEVEENDTIGSWINHPLYMGDLDKPIKELHTKLLKKLGNSEDLLEIFMHIQKPYRLDILYSVMDLLNEREFNKCLIECWVMVEFPSQYNPAKLLSLFEYSKPNLLMNKSELEKYHSLGKEVIIFRGIQSDGAIEGFSWTLDKDKARWFSERFNFKGGKVYQAKIKKDHIFTYTNEREEQEVIVNPNELYDIKCVE